MKKMLYLVAVVCMVLATSCKKDDPQPKNYFTIGDKTYDIAQAAGYLDRDDQDGYDFFLTSDPALKITEVITDVNSYKKVLYIDVPSEKMGKTLTVGKDDFNGAGWDFYFYSFDEKGEVYGSDDYKEFTSGYFESSLFGTTLNMKWDLVHKGVRMTGQYSGPVAMKDFYIVD